MLEIVIQLEEGNGSKGRTRSRDRNAKSVKNTTDEKQISDNRKLKQGDFKLEFDDTEKCICFYKYMNNLL